MDRRLQAGMPSSRGEDWQPLLLYRNSLLHGETDQVPITSKRAYTRRKKDHLAGKKFWRTMAILKSASDVYIQGTQLLLIN